MLNLAGPGPLMERMHTALQTSDVCIQTWTHPGSRARTCLHLPAPVLWFLAQEDPHATCLPLSRGGSPVWG